jgi:hypothetical protein
LADTHSHEVLEDCRGLGAAATAALEQRLLPAPRDLVSVAQVRRYLPTGFGVVALLHTNAMPPQKPHDDQWWSASKAPQARVNVPQGQLLLYGPYLSLPPGRYKALLDGLVLNSGTLEMAITSAKGKTRHASREILPGTGPAWIAFTLDRASQDVEITLRAATKAQLKLPSTLLIYGASPVGSSPWATLGGGR